QGTEVELGQAKSVNVSEDGKTYTYTLRDDIYWENGEPVTAHDFEFGIKRTVDPASSAYPTTSDEII
ncbi:ABC transporter substrate-binding protein, partial [Salmonella enterica]|uniref:ABC transporter substrate-binding protein n=1 Tax=Salmonella enterica TaxID=28901 RepID=UPI000CB73ECF